MGIQKLIQSTPRSQKVGPTIKSVKPNLKKTVQETKSDEYRKRYTALDKAEGKIKSGKQMIKEGQKARKNLIDTKRAFQFKHTKSTHAIKPGEKPEVKYKGNVREQKMGGGMMGRRMGYSQGGKLAVTPREKQLAAQYGDKKRITRGDVITAAKKKSKSPMDKQVRQKAAFGGGADMGKVASNKTKAEVKKYEKRAKDASKFLKNKDRSFGSMMREKYMR